MNPTITIVSSDTGGLTDSIGKVLDPYAEGSPVFTPMIAIGAVGGGVTAYTLAPKKLKLILGVIGAIGGFSAARYYQGPQKNR